MRSHLAAFICFAVYLAEFGRAASAQPVPPETEKDARVRQIDTWVRELNAVEYDVRERATQQLAAAGSDAVAPLARAVGQGSWEVTTRGIFVLQELALADDADTEKAALAALEQVASERRTAVARRAGEALAKLDHLRQQRAVEVFRRLGATFDPEHEERDLFFGAVSEVQIGATWRGEETDLRRLKWLRDVQQVTLSGSFVNDAWLDYLAGMQKLYAVKIKHANLTDAGLARLRDMSTLQYVKLLYVPIGDGAVRYLRECKQLARLKLYGTKISSEGARELVQSLGEKEVDCRRGAFLGISPSELGENWIVNSVTRDSSAEAAGIRAGDVITKYENQTVRDFETLTRLISNNNVGDTVTVEILRDGRTLVKQIKFGEWD